MTKTTLAILAGGEGTRMGRPKADLLVAGQPILAYLHGRFAWPGPTLLVTAPGREHPPGCELFSFEAIDPVAGQGPLRGVLTALEHASAQIVIVATVDMPLVGAPQLRWLIEQFSGRGDAMGLMTSCAGRIEPFPSIFRANAAPVIAAHLDAQQLAVQALSNDPAFVTLPVPDEWDATVWTNLNRPSDVQEFLGHHPPPLR